MNDLVCPACGLACDDLSIRSDTSGISTNQVRCQKSVEFFNRANLATNAEPMIAGKPASLDAAIAHAAQLLRSANAPLISGLATDVNGARAAMLLADKAGACIDHSAGAAIFRNTRVVQDSGWFTTTLSEVRNRADLVILIGAGIAESYPRLIERILNPKALFTDSRRVVAIGPDDAGLTQSNGPHQHVAAALTDLPAMAATLRTLYRNANAEFPGSTLPVEALRELAQQMREAHYCCIAWDAGSLEIEHAELCVEMLSELVRDMNVKQRAAGLPLGGNAGSTAANHVCTWQAGFPLRTDFACGTPHHDWWRNDATQRLQQDNADLLIWLTPLATTTAPDSHCPQIVIGHAGYDNASRAEVFIPCGIPGVDHNGMTFRMDSVVALPLRALRDAQHPTAAQVIEAILEAAQ